MQNLALEAKLSQFLLPNASCLASIKNYKTANRQGKTQVGGDKASIGPDPDTTQMLELADGQFKIAGIIMWKLRKIVGGNSSTLTS